MLILLATLMAAAQDFVPARPIGRANWLSPDVYPAEALRSESEGQVYADLVVDPAGRVIDCDYRTSSKTSILGKRACSAIQYHARFDPAKDEHGVGIAGTYRLAINFVLDSRFIHAMLPDMVLTLKHYPKDVGIETRNRVAIMVEPDASISSCILDQQQAPVAPTGVLCKQVAALWHAKPAHDASGRLVRSVQSVTIGFEVAAK